MNIRLDDSLAPAIRAALDLYRDELPELSRGDTGAAITLGASLTGESAGFTFDGQRLTLHGPTLPQLLRGLALFRGFAGTGDVPGTYSERTGFQSIGLMIDASRNAVPTLDTVKLILRRMALLGMNQLMLYTEDTYEVPEQPMIGYLRGRYSQAELRELDAYAAKLGIEIVPCIQALAHLEQMLRWPNFAEVLDTKDILLVDEPKTYALLEQMLRAASAPFRTKRIHLGMDEAHDIGLGRYRQLHGTKPRFEILSTHLKQVHAICQRLGLRPMIWSDMYFRLASATGDYYSPDARIPEEVIPQIPEDLQLVYWDYYHSNADFYRDWIDRHRAVGRDPIFAGGVWTWGVFWANFTLTRYNTEAALQAAREKNLKEVFTTAWGDDGTEADYLSLLVGLTHFAANAYTSDGVASEDKLRRDFRGACDADWDAWRLIGQLDETPGLPSLREVWGGKTPDVAPELHDRRDINWLGANPSKTFLWQDPLLGVVDGNLSPDWQLGEHYAALARKLSDPANRDPLWKRHELPLALARTLAIKAELGQRLHRAYQASDRDTLHQIASDHIPAALVACEAAHEAHRRLWHSLYKPFGWEVIDARYATLSARLRTAQRRVQQWLAGEIETIDELEAPRLKTMPWTENRLAHGGWYRRLVSPSTIT